MKYLISMSKRLKVLLGELEYRDLKKLARRNQMSVSEWVRHAIHTMSFDSGFDSFPGVTWLQV